MTTLNPDQLLAKAFIHNWWLSPRAYAVLEGRAGVGKTFLVAEVLKSLISCVPLVTAPTNEAVRQLEKSLGDAYPLKTTYSALGFIFDTSGAVEKLKHTKIPADMDKYTLLVVDEGSMVGDLILDKIADAKIRVLFLGHQAQLPEVNTKLTLRDECKSPVFAKGYPTYTLTQPVRHTGKLYEFCNHLENLIYAKIRVIKSDYNMPMAELESYFDTNAGNDFSSEHTKMICWSNKVVDKMNRVIRELIFGTANLPLYLPTDKIILTKPSIYIGDIEDRSVTRLCELRSKGLKISTNSGMTIDEVIHCNVLGIECYKLKGRIGTKKLNLYLAKEVKHLSKFLHDLKIQAFGYKTVQAKQRAFRRLHYISSLFAKVKHSYALTAYRAQGMTIPRVIVRYDDISRCRNVYLKHKLLYVAASRAKNELGIVR